MKLTKELVPADVLQEIFDSPIPYRDAEEEKLTKVSHNWSIPFVDSFQLLTVLYLVRSLHSLGLVRDAFSGRYRNSGPGILRVLGRKAFFHTTNGGAEGQDGHARSSTTLTRSQIPRCGQKHQGNLQISQSKFKID